MWLILYGDNLPEQKPIAGVKALEIFLAQAGLTLERVLLEKRLQELDGAAEARLKQKGEGVTR